MRSNRGELRCCRRHCRGVGSAGLLVLLLSVLLPAGCLHAAESPAQEAGKQPGLRFVHIGNSHSQTCRLLDPLAKTTGHPQHQDDEISILGPPLWWNWDHPEQNNWKEKLGPDKPWDALLLLCWNNWTGNDKDLKDTAIAPMFAAEVYKANPQCQVLLYTIWPDANQDMQKPPEVRSEAWTEKVAEAMVKAHPKSPRPKVIPSSLLIREIGRLADRGEIPGMKTRFEVYSDGGHLSDIGRYAVLVMVCAMLYDESPLDYPDQIVRYDTAGNPLTGVFTSIFPTPETSRALRRIVWDILCTYPPAGMKPQTITVARPVRMGEWVAGYRHGTLRVQAAVTDDEPGRQRDAGYLIGSRRPPRDDLFGANDVYEILVYDRVLPEAELDALHEYLLSPRPTDTQNERN